MDNKKAIDLLSMIEFEHAECCLNTWFKGIDDDMKEALDMAIKALEQTRWIPVSEPPKEEGRYICDYGDCIDFGSYHDGHWYIQGAVAYMLLPQPYKGESEG